MTLEPQHPNRLLLWSPAVDAVCEAVPHDVEAYLVGGAVRDAYLHRPIHDIDLATPGDGGPVARRIANALGGHYYSLDVERGVGRALVPWEGGQMVVDVAQFRGPDLLADLRLRDFTINALAMPVRGERNRVIDPLGGMADLERKVLRRCGPESIASDPVRGLRAVRASVQYGLRIEPETQADMRAHARQLAETSPERVRDEFFQMLGSAKPGAALAAAARLGLLSPIIPELDALPAIEQTAPHQYDVWWHTLRTVERLDDLLRIVGPHRDLRNTSNIGYGAVAIALSHLRPQLSEHLSVTWANGRPHRTLLLLAALLHDTGKAQTREVDDEGRAHFYGHEKVSRVITTGVGERLRLSRDEIARLATITGHHMRPHWLADADHVSARAIYRFWRDTGVAGVDVCLLGLADYLATVGSALDQGEWLAYVETQQQLLNRYFLEYEQSVAPPPLLSGDQLMRAFDLRPGPEIGAILEGLREAQATGEIASHEDALAWVRRYLNGAARN